MSLKLIIMLIVKSISGWGQLKNYNLKIEAVKLLKCFFSDKTLFL